MTGERNKSYCKLCHAEILYLDEWCGDNNSITRGECLRALDLGYAPRQKKQEDNSSLTDQMNRLIARLDEICYDLQSRRQGGESEPNEDLASPARWYHPDPEESF